MRIILNIFLGLIGLVVAAVVGAFFWFWATPVGINNLVNKQTLVLLFESPELMTAIGAIDNTPLDFHSGKLGDYTKANDDKQIAGLKKARAQLDRFNPEKLKGQEKLTYEIVGYFYDNLIEQAEFEHGGYRVNQISGPMVDLPRFLTDQHVIKTEKSVKRYISRLKEFGRVLDEVRVRVEADRAAGVVPPDFVIEKSLVGMRAFIEGGVDANPLVSTLPAKMEKIGLSAEAQSGYLAQAKDAVETQVIPGYQAMIALFEDMANETNHDAGIWRIPGGDRVYQAALRNWTTTSLSADDLHETGLSEVARVEQEMDAILAREGSTEGSVSERVKALYEDPAQIFPNTDEGRQALLDYLVALNDEVMAKAGNYFITLPPQPLEILRIPEYSQDSAPGGYYQPPALDGSLPGRFYINLKDTKDNPRFSLPTLLYHEAAPGHHFQLSASQLIEGVPFLRKFSPFSAYSEGWALYAERIAHTDMGMYADNPLGDLGRLQAEMFRAVRLVVDTGMHARKWSREEAIDYMISKTGMTEEEVTREIERYVVWPGQATAYKTGQLAILQLRAEAEAELGDRFDLRQFHENILMNGAMPLGVLQTNVRAWIAEKKAAS